MQLKLADASAWFLWSDEWQLPPLFDRLNKKTVDSGMLLQPIAIPCAHLPYVVGVTVLWRWWGCLCTVCGVYIYIYILDRLQHGRISLVSMCYRHSKKYKYFDWNHLSISQLSTPVNCCGWTWFVGSFPVSEWLIQIIHWNWNLDRKRNSLATLSLYLVSVPTSSDKPSDFWCY